MSYGASVRTRVKTQHRPPESGVKAGVDVIPDLGDRQLLALDKDEKFLHLFEHAGFQAG
jgi:hypothetical protein